MICDVSAREELKRAEPFREESDIEWNREESGVEWNPWSCPGVGGSRAKYESSTTLEFKSVSIFS